jgi:hypothetical protein
MIVTQIVGDKVVDIRTKYDKVIYDADNKCRKSSINNPMGNSLLYTPVDDLNLKLCKLQEKQIDDNVKFNVYNDSSDLFLKKNNIRSFITMPSQTHPNDIDSFKNYLYNFDHQTCKVDQINCMFNEDVRYHKTDFV